MNKRKCNRLKNKEQSFPMRFGNNKNRKTIKGMMKTMESSDRVPMIVPIVRFDTSPLSDESCCVE